MLWSALFGAACLAGCTETGAFADFSVFQRGGDAPVTAQTTTRLAGDAIKVSGPDGYCVDPDTRQSTANSGFAALASCRIITGGQIGPIVEPALVTVTVSPVSDPPPDVDPTPNDLATALNTELLETQTLSALSLGKLATGGETAFLGSNPAHWRGAFVHGPYLIGVTLYAPTASPLLGPQGAAFVDVVAANIRAHPPLGSDPQPDQRTTELAAEDP